MTSRSLRLAAFLFFAPGFSCVQAPDRTVYIEKEPAPSVSLSGPHGVLVGRTVSLSAMTEHGEDSTYTWNSLDEFVATVDADGKVTAIAAGETTITAKGVDTGALGRHALVVVETAAELPASVTVSGSSGLYVQATVTLSAETMNGGDSAYTWNSSDEAVASVDAAGLVTGVAVGETTIIATGVDTGAVGRHPIVVMPADAAPGPTLPYFSAWSKSAHADKTAEAFTHWNVDDPPEVPTDCARCHSGPGYLDYIGEDGSAAGSVEAPVPVGTVVECATCHNQTTADMDSVTFPSGVVVDRLGPEARCMTCHQGRASTDTVNLAISDAAAATDDTPSNKLSFLNIHYYAAGATLYAGRVRGGYQYDGQVYDWNFRHVDGLDTCVGCHDPHSLEVKVETCGTCHAGVATQADLKNIRMMASRNQDYDGDGNHTEGIFFELDGLRNRLFEAIRAYATGEGFGAICYSGPVYPYWFQDSDENGECSPEEAVFANRYPSWTARLVRAAYNYQVSLKDPGAFAHNAKYIIQLLHDSTVDLGAAIGRPELIGNAIRNDFGHLNGASEAARHWDQDEEVGAACSKCHGGSEGFRFFLQYGVGKSSVAPDNGLECSTCHDDVGGSFTIANVPSVMFPSGINIASNDSLTNLCSTCHSGRESKATIDAAIAQNKLSFKNVHYLPAAAVRQGSAAQVGYEYNGRTYAGPWVGHPGGDGCNACHSAKNTDHSFLPADNFTTCQTCHTSATQLSDIRSTIFHSLDYDGDGNSEEPLSGELAGLGDRLLAKMQDVVVAAGGTGLCYDEHSYPYFFIDTNGNRRCDGAAEAVGTNGFKAWTAGLMKAAHNYQISKKDPGAWAHNFNYVGQLLFDSILDLGGPTTGLRRP